MENLSRSTFSAKVFAVYLFIVGALLVFVPNFLLPMFRMATTSEVWIRVVGLLAFNIGVYMWRAAKRGDRAFLETSLYTRLLTFVVFTTFVIMGLASPMLVLFGVVDLCGAIWTYFALKADAGSIGPAPMSSR
jgi:hypothetical protein